MRMPNIGGGSGAVERPASQGGRSTSDGATGAIFKSEPDQGPSYTKTSTDGGGSKEKTAGDTHSAIRVDIRLELSVPRDRYKAWISELPRFIQIKDSQIFRNGDWESFDPE